MGWRLAGEKLDTGADEAAGTPIPTAALEDAAARARRLAVCLIECGDDIGAAERHLVRLQFHPAIIADAVRWAWSLHYGQTSPEAA